MSDYSKEPVELSVKLLQVSEKALLVTEEVKDKEDKLITHWVPRSQIENEEEFDWEIGKVITFSIPRWLFEKKGFTNG